jgi:hypothetical protein
MMMATDNDREEAQALLGSLAKNRLGGLRDLRAQARQATDAGDDDLGRALTLEANRLSRARTRIAIARDKVLLAESLAGPIAELRRLTGEAQDARARLRRISEALDAARRLVDIFRRLIGLFG